MKPYRIAVIIVSTLVALAAPLLAANGLMYKPGNDFNESDNFKNNKSVDNVDEEYFVPTISELHGMGVFSRQGEKIGEIEEVVVDKKTGKINFVTLTKGGFFGIGAEEIPLPLETISFQRDRVTLTVDVDLLWNPPEQVDGGAEEKMRQRLEQNYGISPAWNHETGKHEKTTPAEKKKRDH